MNENAQVYALSEAIRKAISSEEVALKSKYIGSMYYTCIFCKLL